MTTPGKTSFTIVNLNFDVLTTLASHLEAEDLLSWGMTCKKFYRLINSEVLWVNAALRLQADRVALPLPYGRTAENCDLKTLVKAAAKASRLRRNLAGPNPRLYHSTAISPPLLRIRSKDRRLGHLNKVAYVFDGRWIVYRWYEGLYVRHVEATKFKQVFEIPIMEFSAWSFDMEQLSEDVALVTMKNDIVNFWNLMEITFGKDKATKPRVRPIHLGDPTQLSLIGSGFAVVTRDNQPALHDCRRLQSVALENAHSDQSHYIYKNGILFSVSARDDGVFAIVAQRVDTQPTLKLHSQKSQRFIKMRRECPVYPSGQQSIDPETSVRCVSDDMLTIWYRVRVTGDDGPQTLLYVIEVFYKIFSDDLTTAPIEWGGWNYSSVDLPDGNCYIGGGGLSLLHLYSRMQRNATLAAYPRQRIVGCEHGRRKISAGCTLPLPDDATKMRDSHHADATWDDVHGILVVFTPSGTIWILRYA